MTATSVQDIVNRAMRALNVVAAGKAATGNDAADGLRALQDAVMSLPMLMDGPWIDVFLTDASAYGAADGERIFTQGHAATITLPTTYENDDADTVATLDAGRVQIVGAGHEQEGVWVYSASLAAWARVDALEISADMPFGKEHDAGFAGMIAASLAGEYGAQVPEVTLNRAVRTQRMFKSLFRRPAAVEFY